MALEFVQSVCVSSMRLIMYRGFGISDSRKISGSWHTCEVCGKRYSDSDGFCCKPEENQKENEDEN